MPNSGVTMMRRQKTQRKAAGRIGGQNRDIGAEREDRRMRDVQDAQQAVDQSQADRHHGVHAAEADAGYGQIDVIHR